MRLRNSSGLECLHARPSFHFVSLSELVKTTFSIAFFTVLFTGVYSIPEKQIDSLRNIWQNQTMADTVRILALYDMAIDGYLYSQPDSARYFAEHILREATLISHKGFIADAHSLMGASYLLTGQYTEALSSFNECKRVSANNGFDSKLIKVNINIGGVYLRTGQFEEALKLFFESHELLEAKGDSIIAAQCLSNIGLVYMNMNNYSAALEYFKRSLSVFEKTGKLELINYAQGNIATIYAYQGKTDSALSEFYKLLEIRRDLNDMHGMVTTHNSIATNLLLKGNVTQALEHYQKTVAISEQINDKDGIALAMIQIANTYKQIGVLDSAMSYYQNAIELRREMQASLGIAKILMNMVDIEITKKNYEKANSYLSESRKLAIAAKDSIQLSEVILSEAKINTISENYGLALEQLSNAAKIQRSFSDSVRLATTFYNLGELQMKRNDLSAARFYAEHALDLSLKFGGIEHKRNAHGLMYKVLKTNGEFPQALSHHEAFISMRDSLANDENRNSIMRQSLDFEFERKEFKANAKRAEKDAKTAVQIERQRQMIFTLSGGTLLLLVAGVSGFYIYRQRQRNKSLADSIASRDYERNRLSRELHDGVANELYGVQMAIDSGQYALDAKMLNDQLRRIREDVRHISHDLAMPDIQHTSLPEMARYLVNRWKHVGREVSIDISPKSDSSWEIKPDKALHLYRMLQEGLTNALRYAPEDREIIVRLHLVRDSVQLEIINHYIETLVGQSTPGIGLRNLQERAELIGGSAKVEMDNGLAKLLAEIKL